MKTIMLCTASALLLTGCMTTVQKLEPNVDRGYLKQTIQFNSTPSGALCDVSSLKRKEWLDIPKIVEYREQATSFFKSNSKEIWQQGVKLATVPNNAALLHQSVTMPAPLKIERRSDVLVLSCQKDGYETDIRAYTYIDNDAVSTATLFDPTWVAGDYYASETGLAYLYPEAITVNLLPVVQ